MLIDKIRKRHVSEIELAVYRDPGYPSSWIEERKGSPDIIAWFLMERNCKKLDAEQLRVFMLNAIDKRNAHEKLLIFSQDVVPETVVEEFYSKTTLREYLDAGGSVLWMGDIPLYYIGVKGKDKPLEAWRNDVLGIIPLFLIPKISVNFTPYGEEMGLRWPWTGIRPIRSSEKIQVLAETKEIIAQYYVNPKRFVPKGIGNRPNEAKPEGKITLHGLNTARCIPSSEGMGKLQDGSMDPPVPYGTSVNAWVKRYSDCYPDCGFFRIWDCMPGPLDDIMLRDLLSMVDSIEKRLIFLLPYRA